MFVALAILNGLLGLFIFESTWARTKKHREVDEVRDNHFPAWRRYDAPGWRKWQFYPLAVTVMPLRILGFILTVILLALVNYIACLGADMNKDLPVWRRRITKFAFTFFSIIASLILGVIGVPQWPAADYSKWLGKYPSGQTQRCSTYVSNHTGFFDILLFQLCCLGDVSYLAGSQVCEFPFLKDLVFAGEGLICPRGGSAEVKQLVVEQIKKRQTDIDSGKTQKSPLFIFAEGATSNNTVISPFHRGAFESLKPVIPVTFKYYCPQVNVSDAVITDPDILVLMACCLLPTYCEIKIYPVFIPTEEMFKKDPTAEKWQVYANAVRAMMLQESGLQANDQHWPEHAQYWKYLSGKSPEYLIKHA